MWGKAMKMETKTLHVLEVTGDELSLIRLGLQLIQQKTFSDTFLKDREVKAKELESVIIDINNGDRKSVV